MKPNNFSKRLDFGQEGQDILINILEKHFGYSFIAGERYGNIENVEFIEEMENCEFIPPQIGNWTTKPSGAKLKFIDRAGFETKLTMPDVFMQRINQKLYWVEVKRHVKNSDVFVIDLESYVDYVQLSNITRNEFYVMCINPIDDKTIDIYYCDFKMLFNTPYRTQKINGNVVCVWSILETMDKLNRYPLKIDNYR